MFNTCGVPELIFKPCYLLLEDETYSTRYHEHAAKYAKPSLIRDQARLTFVHSAERNCGSVA